MQDAYLGGVDTTLSGAGRVSLLEIEGLNSYYADSHMLFDVGLRIETNEVVALLGRNGAGKSTTLKTIAGEVKPRRGAIRLEGQQIAGLEPYRIAHRGVQLVPEERRIFGIDHGGGEPGAGAVSAPTRAPLDEIYGTSRACASAANPRAPSSRAASSRCWRSPAR